MRWAHVWQPSRTNDSRTERVDGSEEGIFAIGVSPAEADEIERKAHGAAGLVTGDTRASVGAQWGEEGVTLRQDFAGFVQEAELAGGVLVVLRGRERGAAAGIPPGAGNVVAGFHDADGVDYGVRLLLCGQQSGTQRQHGHGSDNREHAGRVPSTSPLPTHTERHDSGLLRGFRSQEVFRSERNLPHTDAGGIVDGITNGGCDDCDRGLPGAGNRRVQIVDPKFGSSGVQTRRVSFRYKSLVQNPFSPIG